ncbi:hypothetical protein HKX48_003937 [Thoreauomyces humboldtii]|nr:hypothetical protein HKX48_003937 [Thoreauomyces humboldtii]
MRFNEVATSDFFSDDTRTDPLPSSSPSTPRPSKLHRGHHEDDNDDDDDDDRDNLPDLPPFSPNLTHLVELLNEEVPSHLPSLDNSDVDSGGEEKDDVENAKLEDDAESHQDPTTEQCPSTEELAKQEWVKKMRLQFCVREDLEITRNIIHPDGTLNQDYFRPPKGIKLQGEVTKKWTDRERSLLILGIEKYGIGHFREISEELLPEWVPNDLRVKSMRLMGRQNLQEYRDWKGNEKTIKDEYDRNKEIGLRLDAWKAGVLVSNGDGRVEDEWKANPVKFISIDVNRSLKKQRMV